MARPRENPDAPLPKRKPHGSRTTAARREPIDVDSLPTHAVPWEEAAESPPPANEPEQGAASPEANSAASLQAKIEAFVRESRILAGMETDGLAALLDALLGVVGVAEIAPDDASRKVLLKGLWDDLAGEYRPYLALAGMGLELLGAEWAPIAAALAKFQVGLTGAQSTRDAHGELAQSRGRLLADKHGIYIECGFTRQEAFELLKLEVANEGSQMPPIGSVALVLVMCIAGIGALHAID